MHLCASMLMDRRASMERCVQMCKATRELDIFLPMVLRDVVQTGYYEEGGTPDYPLPSPYNGGSPTTPPPCFPIPGMANFAPKKNSSVIRATFDWSCGRVVGVWTGCTASNSRAARAVDVTSSKRSVTCSVVKEP